MSLPLEDLKSRLLDILFLQDGSGLPDPAQFDDQDWETMLAMVRKHRLGPLLHWRLTRECRDLAVPDNCREFCTQAFRAASMRALLLRRELVLVDQLLASAGIQHRALKGAWLAFNAYPQPGLRPLRDLDILVPAADVLRAFQVLLDGGCSRFEKQDVSLEFRLEHGKHIHPLLSPSGQVSVELHHRLYSPEGEGQSEFELSANEGFWQRGIEEEVVGARIAYLLPTEQLLHLIVHAVYDHQFTNGPLLVADLGYLLRTHSVDWPQFWELARLGGHLRGAVLALRLLERFWGKQAIEWPAGTQDHDYATDALIDISTQLMLCDFEARGDVNLGHGIESQGSLTDKASFLLGKAFPAKSTIAATAPVSEDSLWIYAWYPVRWWKLLTQRLPSFLSAKRQEHLQTEMAQLGQLNSWLKSAP